MALSVGIDVGSTTIKVAALLSDELVYASYLRHEYHVPETLRQAVESLAENFGEETFSLCFTGTGAEMLAGELGIPFLPEMDAEVKALTFFHEKVDVAIEMGGEDAKLIYVAADGSSDQRMNRMCAGGTGAFLEHLAAFLGVDMQGLNDLAQQGAPIYGIASRCGVYAKTDVQALLNQGAAKADIAASVFQAVVNQILSGLAKGRRIEGRVALLGGPLTFLPALSERFVETLEISRENLITPRRGELYPAMGAALMGSDFLTDAASLQKLLQSRGKKAEKSLWAEPLFLSAKAYEDFQKAHDTVSRKERNSWPEAVWLGIDAGSTTLKLVAIDEAGFLVYQDYAKNEADVLGKARTMLLKFYGAMPKETTIAGCGITGYGEKFLKEALSIDFGEVETAAHLRAARFFAPDVTSLLDIGGQDMKYIRLQDGAIREVALNGSCASGCGLFLETFAHTLGMTMEEFVRAAVTASHRLDLGYHCTVLMNSRVHQVQREEMDVGALAAGLCTAVVKNALYRVIHMKDAAELGEKVVVSGGLFANDAVLRALEMIVGRPVVRPPFPGLMGAYGMALLAKERYEKSHRSRKPLIKSLSEFLKSPMVQDEEEFPANTEVFKGESDEVLRHWARNSDEKRFNQWFSSLLSAKEIENLRVQVGRRRCPGCGNHCLLSLHQFSHGKVYVTGNRCSVGERLAGGRVALGPNLAEWQKERIFRLSLGKGKKRGTVGIPRVLTMWQDFPFWNAFWSSLGYEVVTSGFDSAAMSRSAATVPQGVYCYPCRLAHGHVLEMIERGDAQFLWLPDIEQGGEEPELDEEKHASYGAMLAAHIAKELAIAHVPLYHPSWDEENRKTFYDFMEAHFPFFSRKEVDEALTKGYETKKKYREELRQRTKDVLVHIHSEKKSAIVLLGRDEQLDGEVNKGIPYLISRLGVPVLTAGGLYALSYEDEPFSFNARARHAAKMVAADPYLELVQMQSTSCGYDGLTLLEIGDMLREAGKKLTHLSLDQGVSAGALEIRIRSLLAEVAERKRNPSRREERKNIFMRPPLPRAFRLSPLGRYYDSLLAGALQGAGYEVSNHPSLPEVTMKEKAAAVIFLGLGRKGDEVLPSSTLFHQLWLALFLGDLLMRCHLAVKPLEKEKGLADRALEIATEKAAGAAKAGTFHAYKKVIGEILALFEHAKGEGTAKSVGLLGKPWQCMDFLQEKRGEEPISWKVQGMAEWLLNEVSEAYFLDGFEGDSDGGTVCLASRYGAHRALEILREEVNRRPWIDPLESPEEKRDALNRYRDFPTRYPAEGERDVRRRSGEDLVICD